MQPGDPFATKSLDEQRSRQRRWLRATKDSVFKNDADGSTLQKALAGDLDREQVEVALRLAANELAGTALDVDDAETLNRIRPKLQEAEDAFMHQSAGAQHRLELINARIGKRAAVSERDADLEGALVLLLRLADEYANDDYRDPREQ